MVQRRARLQLSARDKAIAATAACYNAGFYLDRFNKEEIPYTSDLTHAGYCAEIAIVMGRTSPMILHVAQRYHQILAKADQIVDADVRPKFKADAAKQVHLWELLERRDKVMGRAKEEREAKERRRPNAYRCAREGCPMKATSQAGLKRCGGPCPDELKPSYCSKDCQNQVSMLSSTQFTAPTLV